MPKYRKLPVEIDAVQLTWPTWSEVCAFIGPFPEGMRGVYVDEDGKARDDFPGDRPDGEVARIGLLIPTLEGTMLAVEDDWIIRGVQGEPRRTSLPLPEHAQGACHLISPDQARPSGGATVPPSTRSPR